MEVNNEKNLTEGSVPGATETTIISTTIDTNPASTSDNVATALAKVGVTDPTIIEAVKELGVQSAADFADTDKIDLVSAGLKPVQANKIIKNATPAETKPPTATPNTDMSAIFSQYTNFAAVSILPSVPDDGSLLEMLRSGGVLKVDRSTVIAALRATFAKEAGLYTIRKKLVELIEGYADDNEEQVDATMFFKLRKQLMRQTYAEIFEGVDGLDGTYVTKGRIDKLFERIDNFVMPALKASYIALDAWVEAYNKQAGNPAMMASIVNAVIGGGASLMPIVNISSDTADLRLMGEDINNAINKAFAGTGAQIAAALAYDASQIRKILENPALPTMIGVPNRDQMLKKLGTSVTSNYAMMEQNLVQYALGFMDVANQPSGQQEVMYFSALWALGQKTFPQLSGTVKPANTDMPHVGGRL